MSDAPSEADVEALFDLAPGDFVSARQRLVARLRAAGERDRARAVAALRRPTLAAWAANQVARHHPALIDAVLDAGADLVREHRRALSGVSGADVRAASRRRHEAVEAAADAASEVLEATGSDPAVHSQRLLATFEACSLGGEPAELLRAGRLERDLPAPTGLGDVGGLALVAPSAAAAAPTAVETPAAPEAVPTSATGAAPVAEDREEDPAAARARADEAADAVRDAARVAARAGEAAREAHVEVEGARERAQAAAQAAREAQEDLASARLRAEEAKARAEAAADAAKEAEGESVARAEAAAAADRALSAAQAHAEELDALAREREGRTRG